MKARSFKTNKTLWIVFSIPAFVACWLYPCVYDKGGSPLLGRLWLDVFHGRQDFGLWIFLAGISLIFAAFAALVGFTVQALIMVLWNRKRGH